MQGSTLTENANIFNTRITLSQMYRDCSSEEFCLQTENKERLSVGIVELVTACSDHQRLPGGDKQVGLAGDYPCFPEPCATQVL